MKKLLALVVVLMIAVMAMTGCSEHESEISKQQRAQAEELESILAEQDDKPDEKLPDADAPEVVVVSVYSLADGNKGLVMNMEDVPELDDWELTQKLKAAGILPDTAQIINFVPEKGIIEYSGVPSLTPRKAQAIINTFAENMEIPGQITLSIDGKEVLTSGYNADYENIDDSYTGGIDDGISASGGPGVK